MEILNRGSFVALDNRDKIDQLIHTARELASEVGVTEGFRSSGQTNHQLGLEMWKGVEYVCRAHEEANIRNLFLSKFLERLREIEKEAGVQVKAVPVATPAPIAAVAPALSPVLDQEAVQPPSFPPPVVHAEPESPPRQPAQDEYLGVVNANDHGEEPPSYADECVPEFDADIEAIVDRLENEDQASGGGESQKPAAAEIDQPSVATPVNAPITETAPNPSAAVKRDSSVEASVSEIPSDEVQSDTPRATDSESIKSIVLAEKEPYNLEACTITAAVQILPEDSGTRRCVVSLRTHDFAPLIAVSEAEASGIIPHIAAALSEAIDQYRAALPAMAADKMKKEKPAAKKQSKTAAKTVKATTSQPKPTANAATATDVASANPETGQSQAGLFT